MRPVMTPRLDEAHDAVGEHLGVDAEVVVVGERAEHRVRDRADAHLQRRAVGDQARHVSADRAVHVVERLGAALEAARRRRA